jgi:hypothetical protein
MRLPQTQLGHLQQLVGAPEAPGVDELLPCAGLWISLTVGVAAVMAFVGLVRR